nr:MAG TPA: hypothetical protein [Caudoviricetes sp.]
MMRMHPDNERQFRRTSASMLLLNHTQRACKGACRRNKSIGQFRGDSNICIRCENRMPKETRSA